MRPGYAATLKKFTRGSCILLKILYFHIHSIALMTQMIGSVVSFSLPFSPNKICPELLIRCLS